MKIIENYNLKQESYIKIGGVVKEFVIFDTVEEISEFAKLRGEMPFIIGNCSNILFSDGGINKTFGTIKNIREIRTLGNNLFEVGAGLKFKDFIGFMKENDLTGFENIAGIPGTIGGLAVINAGAYKKEIFENIEEIEFIDSDFNIKRLKKEKIEFGYRNTQFKENKNIITKVTFKMENGFKWTEMVALLQSRREKQPLEYPNIGSIFKNPKGDFAARLIEECGFKGKYSGGAQVAQKHANFIVNRDNAIFNDVITLIKEIKDAVFEKFGIMLEEEIIIVE
jgi:UDP-N-acetylmuramate dehydrogenase